MARRIEDIEGIGPAMNAALKDAGVHTVDELLEIACDKKGRTWLSRKTHIAETRILKWVGMADLFRIDGVSTQYAELLEGAGVDTMGALLSSDAETLVTEMNDVNAQRNLVRRSPSVSIVRSWLDQAKTLPAIISR